MKRQTRISVSIVIPAYNEERHIRLCLDSIAAQTERPDEVIVVDNNSTDATAAICSEYNFVKVIKEKQQGIVYARNAGFNAAKSDIIGRVDADVEFPEDWVERIRDYYEADPAHLRNAWTGVGIFYNVPLQRAATFGYFFAVYRVNTLFARSYTLWGSNMALPRKMWEDVRHDTCTRKDVHEDLDLGIHIHRAGYGVYVDRTLPTYAELRLVHGNGAKLKEYLMVWPQTLKTHDIRGGDFTRSVAMVTAYPATSFLTSVLLTQKAVQHIRRRVAVFRDF